MSQHPRHDIIAMVEERWKAFARLANHGAMPLAVIAIQAAAECTIIVWSLASSKSAEGVLSPGGTAAIDDDNDDDDDCCRQCCAIHQARCPSQRYDR